MFMGYVERKLSSLGTGESKKHKKLCDIQEFENLQWWCKRNSFKRLN
jgi:hypothetical protein